MLRTLKKFEIDNGYRSSSKTSIRMDAGRWDLEASLSCMFSHAITHLQGLTENNERVVSDAIIKELTMNFLDGTGSHEHKNTLIAL